jgi:hypothetical protein
MFNFSTIQLLKLETREALSKKKLIVIAVVGAIAVFGLIIIIDAIKITIDSNKSFNDMKSMCEGLLNKNATISPRLKSLCVQYVNK